MSMSYRGNGRQRCRPKTNDNEGNMTGLLLESRAKRQRRAGGASLSVAIHTTIIGAIMAGTATGKPAPRREDPRVHLVTELTPAHKPDVVPQTTHTANTPLHSPIVAPTIVVPPTTIPVGLPTIDYSRDTSPDSIVIGNSATAGDAGRPSRTLDLDPDDAPSGREWGVNELLMRVVSSRKPRYPESLRQAGIDGRVLVRFTVDTAGAIDMNSVTILSSTHDLFTRSVRDVLPSFRFKPAEVRGKHVPSLAEMPFEFSISK
jgi:periplasmic protein TonB